MSYCRLLLTPRMTLLIVIGSLIYSVGLNQFIVPVGLYNGGFLGIAQLIRHFMESWFGISFGNTNIAGILYFILNIPLLAVSVKRFGKEFLAKTIYCGADCRSFTGRRTFDGLCSRRCDLRYWCRDDFAFWRQRRR